MDQVNEIDRVILEYEELDAGHNIDEWASVSSMQWNI
jgi:hypothetical protein